MANSDKGAYEYLSLYKGDIYISNRQGASSQDGSSWSKAYSNFTTIPSSVVLNNKVIYVYRNKIEGTAPNQTTVGYNFTPSIVRRLSGSKIISVTNYTNTVLGFGTQPLEANSILIEGIRIYTVGLVSGFTFNRCKILAQNSDKKDYLFKNCKLYNCRIEGTHIFKSMFLNCKLINCYIKLDPGSDVDYIYNGGVGYTELHNCQTDSASTGFTNLSYRTYGTYNAGHNYSGLVENYEVSTVDQTNKSFAKGNYDNIGSPRILGDGIDFADVESTGSGFGYTKKITFDAYGNNASRLVPGVVTPWVAYYNTNQQLDWLPTPYAGINKFFIGWFRDAARTDGPVKIISDDPGNGTKTNTITGDNLYAKYVTISSPTLDITGDESFYKDGSGFYQLYININGVKYPLAFDDSRVTIITNKVNTYFSIPLGELSVNDNFNTKVDNPIRLTASFDYGAGSPITDFIDVIVLERQQEIIFHANISNPIGPSFERRLYILSEPFTVLPTIDHSTARFLGWYTAETGGSIVSINTIVTKSITDLYAHWDNGTPRRDIEICRPYIITYDDYMRIIYVTDGTPGFTIVQDREDDLPFGAKLYYASVAGYRSALDPNDPDYPTDTSKWDKPSQRDFVYRKPRKTYWSHEDISNPRIINYRNYVQLEDFENSEMVYFKTNAGVSGNREVKLHSSIFTSELDNNDDLSSYDNLIICLHSEIVYCHFLKYFDPLNRIVFNRLTNPIVFPTVVPDSYYPTSSSEYLTPIKEVSKYSSVTDLEDSLPVIANKDSQDKIWIYKWQLQQSKHGNDRPVIVTNDTIFDDELTIPEYIKATGTYNPKAIYFKLKNGSYYQADPSLESEFDQYYTRTWHCYLEVYPNNPEELFIEVVEYSGASIPNHRLIESCYQHNHNLRVKTNDYGWKKYYDYQPNPSSPITYDSIPDKFRKMDDSNLIKGSDLNIPGSYIPFYAKFLSNTNLTKDLHAEYVFESYLGARGLLNIWQEKGIDGPDELPMADKYVDIHIGVDEEWTDTNLRGDSWSKPYRTIQFAIDDLNRLHTNESKLVFEKDDENYLGPIIAVNDGVYEGNLETHSGQRLGYIFSVRGPRHTIIKGTVKRVNICIGSDEVYYKRICDLPSDRSNTTGRPNTLNDRPGFTITGGVNGGIQNSAVMNSFIVENQRSAYAGIDNTDELIYNCVIAYNHSTGNCAGVRGSRISNCVIMYNDAGNNIGGVTVLKGGFIINSLIIENSAKNIGGVNLEIGQLNEEEPDESIDGAKMINCTVCNNHIVTGIGGVQLGIGDKSAIVMNSIVTENDGNNHNGTRNNKATFINSYTSPTTTVKVPDNYDESYKIYSKVNIIGVNSSSITTKIHEILELNIRDPFGGSGVDVSGDVNSSGNIVFNFLGTGNYSTFARIYIRYITQEAFYNNPDEPEETEKILTPVFDYSISNSTQVINFRDIEDNDYHFKWNSKLINTLNNLWYCPEELQVEGFTHYDLDAICNTDKLNHTYLETYGEKYGVSDGSDLSDPESEAEWYSSNHPRNSGCYQYNEPKYRKLPKLAFRTMEEV